MCIYLSKLKSLLLIAGIFLIISTESRVADANTLRNHPRNGIPHQRQLFGIELSLPARRLLAEVEQSYGKHVRDEVAINWETVQLGYSFVADDGTPVIQINDNLERKEEVIVHELFHLKQRAKGFYMINFVFSSGAAYYKYAAYCKLLLMLLHEPLQHWIFYPEMRKAGFDPSAVLKADFERAREAGQLADLQAGTTRALTYFRAIVEFDDPQLLMELTHFYQSKGWNDSLEIGNKLAQIVLKAHPHTPGEEIKVFVQCLNYILNGQANCSLERKESQRMGYFTQRIALIEVGPARRPTNSR